MIGLKPFDPLSILLIALLNPVVIAVAIAMGRQADQWQKLIVAGFAAAFAGSLALYAATFAGLVAVRGIGGEGGVFLLQAIFGTIWAWLAWRLGGPGAAPAGATSAGTGATSGETMATNSIPATEAHERAQAGQLVLVDIRNPNEWAETGLAQSARPITMNQPIEDFLAKLAAARGAQALPVALICRSGARTAGLLSALEARGVGNVVHVGEGMLGGPRGPGWIPSGLPVEPWRA
ncbi:MAG: rhodanese-like domain-containing protein [Hyphomicrobiaceae bacterium]|nr:rhodanese-like domain-containing protein [Hyphomicrobiaceae bacterium]